MYTVGRELKKRRRDMTRYKERQRYEILQSITTIDDKART